MPGSTRATELDCCCSAGRLFALASRYAHGRRLYGLPARYSPDKRPNVGIVANERELLAQFDDAGQLTAVFISSPDCFGGDVINSEH